MLDPAKNPYTPNAGSRPLELAGRDELLEGFRILLERVGAGVAEQSVIGRGLRGVGKTVLLNAFEDLAEAAGFLVFYHELTPESNLAEEVVRDLQSALRQLKLGARVRATLGDALSHLRSFKLTLPGDVAVEVDFKGGGEAALTRDLTDLFVEVGKIASDKGAGIVFLFDELQNAKPSEWRAIISALHRVNQRNLPIIAAGAGLPQIPKLSGEARSYAERLFDIHLITNLDTTAATAALVEPAKQRGVKYSKEAVKRAIEWSEGYPFYIQQIGKHAWNLAERSPIDVETIERAIPLAEQALDRSLYEVRLQRATEFERTYLRAMADLGRGPYGVGQVAQKLGRTTKDLSEARSRLIQKGLIYATEDHGHLDFTVPRFDEFLRRKMAFVVPPRQSRRGRPAKRK